MPALRVPAGSPDRAQREAGPRRTLPEMTGIVDSATTRDRVRLVTRHWPASGPHAAALVIHGVGEHSGRFEEVGQQLAAAGIEAFAWDLRGFGQSAGDPAWVDSWARFFDDVEERLAAVRAAVPGLPVVLYGHSMGGLIALGYAESDRPRPDLLVLSAPGVADDLATWKHVLAPILGRITPRLRIENGIRASMRSRDPARQDAADHDPLMLDKSTARLGALAFAEQPRVRAAADRLRVPTLVIHGLDDPIVPARATEFLEAIPGVTRRTYAGIRHELHNEPEGPAILGDVIAWIDAQVSARPGGAEEA
jgi:acylglycerol lipase